MTNPFIGTGVALVTPFLKTGEIDYESFEALIEYVIQGGVDYLVPLGSTGEASTLNPKEQQEILDFVSRVVKKRKPIVAGCFGGNDTKALIKKLETFDLSGVDAVLSSSPHYNKPSQEGIFQHYMAINNHSSKPVIMYNVPGRTSSNVSAKTTIRIANNCDKVFAIKEASGDLKQMQEIISNVDSNFLVLSGDDPSALESIKLGGSGVISVIANAYPKEFSNTIGSALKKNFETATNLNDQLDPIHYWLYIDGNPSGIKAALSIKGLCKQYVRLPLVQMSTQHFQSLQSTLV